MVICNKYRNCHFQKKDLWGCGGAKPHDPCSECGNCTHDKDAKCIDVDEERRIWHKTLDVRRKQALDKHLKDRSTSMVVKVTKTILYVIYKGMTSQNFYQITKEWFDKYGGQPHVFRDGSIFMEHFNNDATLVENGEEAVSKGICYKCKNKSFCNPHNLNKIIAIECGNYKELDKAR